LLLFLDMQTQRIAHPQTQTKTLVIVYSPVGGGHRAAAEALSERALMHGHRVKLLNAFDFAPRWFGDMYKGAHLTGQGAVPTFYGAAYEQANRRGGLWEPLRLGFDELTFARLSREVCNANPDEVIVTHHLPLVGLAKARARGQLNARLTCVVTDYTAHAVWAEKHVDRFAVASEGVARELRSHGVRSEIVRSGIPVKRAFEAIPSLRALQDHEPLRVLITSGGFAVGPMMNILRGFRGSHNVHLTIVCGNNAEAEKRARNAVARHALDAEVVGFESNMAARMERAHVVVGKAGGLTVSEALTAARPMILVGTVPGNETSNEVHVETHGAGLAARAKSVAEVAQSFRAKLPLLSLNARRAVMLGSADCILNG
jgi:processive 1,2-diacylglycerol beta-glucosyltransferase